MNSFAHPPLDRRSKLLAGLSLREQLGLEIGALCRPFLRREDGPVLYVDHADTATLREKYRNDPNVDVDAIVDIDAVWGACTLSQAIGGRKVDYVVASHVIEHVPNLIGWLHELREVLSATGEVRLIVPDKRFTFDRLRDETRVESLLYSHLVGARVPQPQVIIDHVLNVVNMDCGAAWRSAVDATQLEHLHDLPMAMGVARDCIDHGNYHDVHCWVFSPQSFARLFRRLAEMELIDFACGGFFDTERNGMEFFVTLAPSTNRAYILESWHVMERLANPYVPGFAAWKVRRMLKTFADRRRHGTQNPLDELRSTSTRYVEERDSRLPPDFDRMAYLLANPDVAAAGMDPVRHFIEYGLKENRRLRP